MNRQARYSLGILSAAPLLFVMAMMASSWLTTTSMNWTGGLAPLAIVVWLTLIGVFLIFAIYLIRTSEFKVHQKTLWFVLFLAIPIFALPVFWWMYFMKPPASGSTFPPDASSR